MSNTTIVTLGTLPVELTYRILDNLDGLTIHLSLYNTCSRLNRIIDAYHQCKVSLSFIFKSEKHKSAQQYIILIIVHRINSEIFRSEIQYVKNSATFNELHSRDVSSYNLYTCSIEVTTLTTEDTETAISTS